MISYQIFTICVELIEIHSSSFCFQLNLLTNFMVIVSITKLILQSQLLIKWELKKTFNLQYLTSIVGIVY